MCNVCYGRPCGGSSSVVVLSQERVLMVSLNLDRIWVVVLKSAVHNLTTQYKWSGKMMNSTHLILTFIDCTLSVKKFQLLRSHLWTLGSQPAELFRTWRLDGKRRSLGEIFVTLCHSSTSCSLIESWVWIHCNPPASCSCLMLCLHYHNGLHTSGFTSQNKSFLPYIAFVWAFYLR